MKTNFFELLASLNIKSGLLMNINPGENGMLTVSAMFTKAGNVPPLIFKNTPAELGEEFFGAFAQPVKQITGLVTNLETYNAEVEKSKKTLVKDKDKKNGKDGAKAGDRDDDDNNGEDNSTGDLFSQKNDTESKVQKKLYVDGQLTKAKELAQQLKFTEALAQLPDPAEYPEQAELIKSKKLEITKGKDIYDKLQQQFND